MKECQAIAFEENYFGCDLDQISSENSTSFNFILDRKHSTAIIPSNCIWYHVFKSWKKS